MGALHAHVREGARLSASTSELLRIKSRTMANNQDYTEDMAQGDFSNESNYGDFQQTEAQVFKTPPKLTETKPWKKPPMETTDTTPLPKIQWEKMKIENFLSEVSAGQQPIRNSVSTSGNM